MSLSIAHILEVPLQKCPATLIRPAVQEKLRLSRSNALLLVDFNERNIYHSMTGRNANEEDYLSILGLVKGESEYTYPPYSDVQARELIDGLRNIAPYVVIDCGSYIANDILSAVALMESDAVLRLANADLKSISYLSSQLPLLKDAGWDLDKQYKTASNVKPQQAGDHMAKALGTVAFTLPYSAEVESLYLAGDLLGELSMKDSRVFRKEIEKISKEVFGC